jgi:UDP-glucose 4-epimerase
MNILLTGGAGYIGSHTAVVLAEAEHRVFLYDNFYNSRRGVVDSLKSILSQSTVHNGKTLLTLIEGDVRDTSLLTQTLQDYEIDAVVHFAGLKAVGESVLKPIDYYENNVQGTISLLRSMQIADVKILVFSSSATVYGDPQYLPINELHPTCATNPYGRSKLHIEEMLADVASSDESWRIVCLRYFNPVGAHKSGLIGEYPSGIPNNLMPYISKVAVGELPFLKVFGNDYDTIDGTGIRDYIHVMDLAEGHLATLDWLGQQVGFNIFNLGTGVGYSVLQMVGAFEDATGKAIPYQINPRRPGDIAKCYAVADMAASKLNWRATRTLQAMCKSTWKFQSLKRTQR